MDISYPDPVTKCDLKKLDLGKIKCNEVKEQYCYETVESEDYEVQVEVCNTTLGTPKCENRQIAVPEEVCVTEMDPPPPTYNY